MPWKISKCNTDKVFRMKTEEGALVSVSVKTLTNELCQRIYLKLVNLKLKDLTKYMESQKFKGKFGVTNYYITEVGALPDTTPDTTEDNVEDTLTSTVLDTGVTPKYTAKKFTYTAIVSPDDLEPGLFSICFPDLESTLVYTTSGDIKQASEELLYDSIYEFLDTNRELPEPAEWEVTEQEIAVNVTVEVYV